MNKNELLLDRAVDYPLRFASLDDFTRVYTRLKQDDFQPAAVWKSLAASGLNALGPEGQAVAGHQQDRESGILIKLFVELRSVPQWEVERVIDSSTLRSFLALDLLRASDAEYHSPVFLYPVDHLLIASDRYDGPPGLPLGWDSVYPAIESRTLRLRELFPRSPTQSALDLGTGSGVHALLLSSYAEQVTAVDINPRASHFAHFNSLLNRCKIEVLTGDLYSPVKNRSFDQICSFPPSTPSTEQMAIWRDGGPTGEAILRQIIEGLPKYLRPGGRFTTMCLGYESENISFLHRVRSWLGSAEAEFDTVFAVQDSLSPSQVLQKLSDRTVLDNETSHWLHVFEQAHVTKVAFGILAMRRHQKQERAFSVQTHLSPTTNSGSFDFAFARGRLCLQRDFLAQLPQLKPRLAAHLRLTKGCVLEIAWPFSQQLNVDPGLVPVVRCFNGTRAVKDVYIQAQLEGTLSSNVKISDFVTFITTLLSRGYLELPDLKSIGVP